MKISESQFTNASPADALNAAERWLRHEVPDQEPVHGHTPEGIPYVGFDQLIDGIQITTRFLAQESGDGTNLTFHLHMQGESFLGKIRNLGMLPARKYVRRASKEQFNQILADLENPDVESSR